MYMVSFIRRIALLALLAALVVLLAHKPVVAQNPGPSKQEFEAMVKTEQGKIRGPYIVEKLNNNAPNVMATLNNYHNMGYDYVGTRGSATN